jgi:hypothetical protein
VIDDRDPLKLWLKLMAIGLSVLGAVRWFYWMAYGL